MKGKKHSILSTKKLSEPCLQLLTYSDIELTVSNFIKINFLSVSKEVLEKNIICTSQNALKSLVSQIEIEELKNKQFYCVGNKTKQRMEELGLQVVENCSYSEELANVLVEGYGKQTFTFISGTIRMAGLPKILTEYKMDYTEHHVYETLLTPIKVDENLDGVLFYSPSGVKSFLKENKIENKMCFCIGKTTANALQGITTNIKIASEPTIQKTVEACITYFA